MTASDLEELQYTAQARDGVVYFLQVENKGPVKIGFTQGNPALRMCSLQQSSPYELRWIGYIQAGREKEKELHGKFADFTLRGEWFHPVAPVLAYIRSACPNFDSAKARWDLLRFDVLKEVRALIPVRARQANWGFIECLEKIGIARYDFWCWQSGTRSPTDKFLAGVREALQLYRDMHRKAKAAA